MLFYDLRLEKPADDKTDKVEVDDGEADEREDDGDRPAGRDTDDYQAYDDEAAGRDTDDDEADDRDKDDGEADYGEVAPCLDHE